MNEQVRSLSSLSEGKQSSDNFPHVAVRAANFTQNAFFALSLIPVGVSASPPPIKARAESTGLAAKDNCRQFTVIPPVCREVDLLQLVFFPKAQFLWTRAKNKQSVFFT